MDKATTNRLVEAAKAVSKHSYSGYSGFAVGAALLGENGEVYRGTNVENASFGLTSCAERNAVFTAVSQGCVDFEAVVIYTPTQNATPPCGACRQVLAEFSPSMRVISVCDADHSIDTTVAALLPACFDKSQLAPKG